MLLAACAIGGSAACDLYEKRSAEYPSLPGPSGGDGFMVNYLHDGHGENASTAVKTPGLENRAT